VSPLSSPSPLLLPYLFLLSADDVRAEFKKFGPIADVWIARQPPGFAFVEVNKVTNTVIIVITHSEM
jgi:RNA recognition motif-containing protein